MDKLELILQKITEMDCKFDKLESRFDNLESRFDNLESKVDMLQSDMRETKEWARKTDERLGRLEAQTEEINMRIENEVIFSIRAVADGHVDLSRRINLVADDVTERTNVKIRILELQNEVRKINQRCSKCA